MFQPQLLLSVWEGIFEVLATDKLTLSALSVCCKAFVIPTSRRLFRKILFNGLKASTHQLRAVIPHVRELRVEEEGIETILRCPIPHLYSLIVAHYDFGSKLLSPTRSDSSLRVTNLQLWMTKVVSNDHLLSFISSFPNLKSLNVSGTVLTRTREGRHLTNLSDDYRAPRGLETLEMAHNVDVVVPLSYWLLRSEAQPVHLSATVLLRRGEIAAIGELLKRKGRCLRSLTFSIAPKRERPLDRILQGELDIATSLFPPGRPYELPSIERITFSDIYLGDSHHSNPQFNSIIPSLIHRFLHATQKRKQNSASTPSIKNSDDEAQDEPIHLRLNMFIINSQCIGNPEYDYLSWDGIAAALEYSSQFQTKFCMSWNWEYISEDDEEWIRWRDREVARVNRKVARMRNASVEWEH